MPKRKGFRESFLAMRLLAARRSVGMPTRRVAFELQRHGLNISHATIANYERGDTKPPLTVLAVFADFYQRPINWFLDSDPVLRNVKYRALKKVRVSEKREFEGLAQKWLDCYRKLEQLLEISLEKPLSDFKPVKNDSGRKTAAQLREELKIGDRPITSVVETLQKFGIRVMSIDSSAKIDGLCGKLDSETVVVLNSRLSNDRVRLNAAHELGHYLFEEFESDNDSTEKKEKRAFEFASHFLLPPSMLKSAFDGYSMVRLVEFKKRFGISIAAMIYRARDNGIISAEIYTNLWKALARRGWRKFEPGYVGPDRPTTFEQMLEVAIRSRQFSRVELSKRLDIRENEMQERLDYAIQTLTTERKGESKMN